MLKFQDSDGEEDAWGYSFPASIVPLLRTRGTQEKNHTYYWGRSDGVCSFAFPFYKLRQNII